jgi:hypothetical protein
LFMRVWRQFRDAVDGTRTASGPKSGDDGGKLERQMNGRLRPGSGAIVSRLCAKADGFDK